MDFKKLGNESFLEKKYIQAIDHYTKGLESSCLTPEELANLRLNRVACYIKLECFCKGLEDTEIVLSQLPHNTKAIYRKVKCLWGLQCYQESLNFINEQLAILPHLYPDKELGQIRRKAEIFVSQSKTGHYDIVELMKHQETRPKEPVDVAQYTAGIKIRDITGKGRGLIATQDFKTGQLVLCCKPFAFHSYDQLYEPPEVGEKDKVSQILVAQMLEKFKVEPELAREVLGLYPGPDLKSLSPTEITELIKKREFDLKRLESIVCYNSFEFSGSSKPVPYYWSGLWTTPSFINHSCSEANCCWAVYGDSFFARAVKPIYKGDEILISYTNVTWPYDDRKVIMVDHKFVCDCRLCEYERSEDHLSVEKRKIIFEKLEELYVMETKIPNESVLACFRELVKLRKDFSHQNLILANPLLVNVVKYFFMQNADEETNVQCLEMFEKIHSECKNTSHAKYVPIICISILNCMLESDGTELVTLQKWVKQLKNDLIAAHGSPKALKSVDPDMFNILQDMFLANDFV